MPVLGCPPRTETKRALFRTSNELKSGNSVHDLNQRWKNTLFRTSDEINEYRELSVFIDEMNFEYFMYAL